MASTFAEGQVVKVLQRQWPGVNKPGGIARIFKVNADNTLGVAYVLGNEKEAAVDPKVIRPTDGVFFPVYLPCAFCAVFFSGMVVSWML